MKLLLTSMLSLFSLLVYGQNSIDIPEFKNVNDKEKYPERCALTSYLDRFDILICLKCFSVWDQDHSIKVLAHHQYGWYKIEINTDPLYINNNICYSMYKINDSVGKIIWSTLVQNHLFDMSDERNSDSKYVTKVDTIKHKNGQVEYVEEITTIDDGPEYEFEIFTKAKYKKLYFYCPQDFLKTCQYVREREWFVNCINVFESHLGN